MKVLFVSYGGGHIEMCLPVMRALRVKKPTWDVRVMALTTAFGVALNAGETPLGYRDFCEEPESSRALRFGEQLLSGPQHPGVAVGESIAYLGFNFLEWVELAGEKAAWQLWHQRGRHGFFPVNFFRNVLERLKIDVVVTTNSPRSEQAAIEAAVSLGIPTLSMLDLFSLPGDPFLQRSIYANRLTVLAEVTRTNLIIAGLDPKRIFITGNPAFDNLTTGEAKAQGDLWRAAKGWKHKNIVLWAGHLEAPQASPSELAGSGLGNQVQTRLIAWVESLPDVCLVIRYHPNEWHAFVKPLNHPRIHWSQPDVEPLLPVLLASDQVVVQMTTVGVQAHIAGKRVINIGFSPFVLSSGLDYSLFSMSQKVDNLDMLVQRLEEGLDANKEERHFGENNNAAHAVALHICALTEERSV